MSNANTQLERNLRLYPWYQAAAGFLPWLPIAFLFFFSHVSFSDALKLGAIYYFSVFVLEVPSGYFSDRMGRQLTLVLSCIFALAAYSTFLVSTDFTRFATAQFLLAGFFAFKSGSDNALLFDTLSILKRESEYAQREANATRYSMLALAAAALLGGLSGAVNLTYPFFLSLIGALIALGLRVQFSEPPTDETAAPFFQQIGLCLGRLCEPKLLWLFAFFVLAYSMQHVPAEFNQAYVKLLHIELLNLADSSALVSGSMVAVSMLGGAIGASISIALLNRLGVHKLLIVGFFIMMLIIAGMASVLHSGILLLVLFRNLPMAFSEAPLLSAISPLIKSQYRATYLSMQSLAGRLGFAVLLWTLANLADSNVESGNLAWPQLQSALVACLIIGLIGLAGLVLMQYKAR